MKQIRILRNGHVRRAPYDATRDYDIFFEKFILQVKHKLEHDDEDYLVLYVGPPGGGKSMLSLHGYELFDPDGCDVKYIAFDKMGFANAVKDASKKSLPRFVSNDEANISKRDSMTQYNKDMIDLYFAIRGLNMFHSWCNPSIDNLDKTFIEERLKRLILIYDKSKIKRTYWFFKQDALIKIFEQFGNLKINTLIKCRGLAYYKGWFRDYNGKLKAPYLAKKQSRMVDKVEEFHQKWGGSSMLSREDMKKKLGVSMNTIIRYEKELFSKGLLIDGDNVKRDLKGRVLYNESVYMHFLDLSNQPNA